MTAVKLASMAESIGPRLYSCCNCRNHVALHDDVISKAFQVKLKADSNLGTLFMEPFFVFQQLATRTV